MRKKLQLKIYSFLPLSRTHFVFMQKRRKEPKKYFNTEIKRSLTPVATPHKPSKLHKRENTTSITEIRLQSCSI